MGGLRACFDVLAAVLARMVEPAVGAVCPDRCRLCDASWERARQDLLVAGLGEFTKTLACVPAVSSRWLPVPSQPFCGACAAGLVEAHCAGALSIPGGGQDSVDVVTPFMMNTLAVNIIHLLKFSKISGLAVPVGAAMAAAVDRLSRSGAGDAVVTPVPMDPAARRARGFNQAELLAGVVAGRLGIAVDRGALVKVRPTRRQSLVAHGDRGSNIRGAFELRGRSLRGEDVILVDDLVTTGATSAECVTVLRRGGVRTVTVCGFARAL